MKVEKISDNRLKVVLTSQDLAERRITMPELSDGSEKSRAFCADIIAEVRAQSDFNVDGNGQLMIEMIPMSKDELTIIVSGVNNLSGLKALEYIRGGRIDES